MSEDGAVGLAICPSLGHYSSLPSPHNKIAIKLVNNPIQKQDSFEFKPICADDHKEAFTVSADEIFHNGKIRPIFIQHAKTQSGSNLFRPYHLRSRSDSLLEPQEPPLQPPPSLPSPRHVRMSSEPIPGEFCEWKQKYDDNLGTSCQWKPSSSSEDRMPLPKYKKPSSNGTFRFVKIRNLVGRLGHNQLPHHHNNNKEPVVPMHSRTNKTEGGDKVEGAISTPSSNDATNAQQGGDGRRSRHHPPNRRNVVGFFSNVNKFAHSRIYF